MAKTTVSSSSAAQKPQTTSHHPTQEEIALRAYLIYLKRGGAPGNALEDWIQAERQLAGDNGKPRRKAAVKVKSAAA
jgi:hypothetical protein